MAVPLTTIVSQCLVDIAGGNTATIPAGTTAQLLGASGTAGVANLLTIEATGGASVAITDGIITFGAPVPVHLLGNWT